MTNHVSSIPDEELVKRGVDQLRRSPAPGGRREPLWSAVARRFMLGSTFARQLCDRFGLNPDELVRPGK